MRGDEEAHGRRSARRVHGHLHRDERVGPRRRVERRPSSQVRLAQPPIALDPVVVEAPDVAHPVAVDLGIEPRRHADELRALRPLGLRFDPRGRIAALLAERADRVDGLRVVPRPRLEPVVARRDRADRTDVHQISGQQRDDALLLERGDFAAVAARDDANLRVTVHFAHEPHAARAQDAAIAIEQQRRTEVDVGLHAFAVEHAPRKLHAAALGPERVREILQRALAALVAHRAIERMVDEQELEHARARLNHLGRIGDDHHAVHARRRARRLQLRHLLDLDDAHAARSVDAQARVVAVVGDLVPMLDRGFQHGLALFDGDLAPIYGQRDRVHNLQIIP